MPAEGQAYSSHCKLQIRDRPFDILGWRVIIRSQRSQNFDCVAPPPPTDRCFFLVPYESDLIHDLNGATIFSLLDLRSSYHQLELAPESRYITTFSTQWVFIDTRYLYSAFLVQAKSFSIQLNKC